MVVSTMNKTKASKPKRRWFQFSLRMLLVLVLIVSVPLGWLDVKRRQARDRRQTLAAIKKLGGIGDYDCHVDASGKPIHHGPAWLRKLYGDDLFDTVSMLRLWGPQTTDDALIHVRALPELQRLDLRETAITDAGMAHLQGLTQLQWLPLEGTQVTDAGLVHLRGLTRLRELDLTGLPITDAGMAHLQGLTQLRRLVLTNNPITDAGCAHVSRLTKLRELDLTGTQVTDAGMVHLQGLTQLRRLVLNETNVTMAELRRRKQVLPELGIEPWWFAEDWGQDGRLTPATKKVLVALGQDTRLEFIQTPLQDVVTFLQKQHQIPIHISEPRLPAEPPEPPRSQALVTQNIKGSTLHSALRLILGQFDLTYVVLDEALVITSVEEGQRLVRQGAIGANEVKRALENGPVFPARHKRLTSALQDAAPVQFIATPLEDVVEFLVDQHDVPIKIDQRALVAAGVRPAVPWTWTMPNVTLEAVLQKLVSDVGLSYVVDDEYILITAHNKNDVTQTNDQGK
jgi:hypothetical protein